MPRVSAPRRTAASISDAWITVRSSLLCASLVVLSTDGAWAAAQCAAPSAPRPETDCQRALREKTAEVETLLTRFTELHPDVRALRRMIAQIGECELLSAPVTAAAEDCAPAAVGHTHDHAAKAPAPIARKPAPATATIKINTAQTRQVLEGFGATHYLSVVSPNRMTDSQWRRTVQGLTVEIGATAGVGPPPIEATRPLSPGSHFSRPVDFTGVETLVGFYQRFSPVGTGELYPTANINTIWHHRWLTDMKTFDYPRYLEQIAGKAIDTVAQWVALKGSEPTYLQLWNEPLSGNRELVGGTVRDLTTIIKHTGKRLREAGYAKVLLVVPNEETPLNTIEDMRTIAQDAEALTYIGALGYHSYPYGSDYSYIPRLLSIRAQGQLPVLAVQERVELRNLSRRLGIPVWMTEVSNGYSPAGPRAAKESYEPDSIDWLIGRAIHIHDEFRFAGASAYYGMLAVWTDITDREHFPGGGSHNLRSNGDSLILVDTAVDEVIVTATGRAIGHYGRWLRRGARYLDAESSSPFVLVSPFLDRDRLVNVLVNTGATAARVTVTLDGAVFTGPAAGEQSRADARWRAIEPFATSSASFAVDVPGWSVTTVAAPIR